MPSSRVSDPVPFPDAESRRAAQMARFTASVTALLDHREDLHGVAPMADLVYDHVRWSA